MTGIQPNQNYAAPFAVFEENEKHIVMQLKEPEVESFEEVIEEVGDDPEDLSFYNKALDDLGTIILKYQDVNWSDKEEWTKVDYLTLRIFHWGTESVKMRLTGEKLEDVFKRQLSLLLNEVIAVSPGVPFRSPVIYDGVILEKDFAKEYLSFCVSDVVVLKKHDFAKEIIKWSKPFVDFIFTEKNIVNTNGNPENKFSEGFKVRFYNDKFNGMKTRQMIELSKIRKIVMGDKLVKDKKANEVELRKNIELLKNDLKKHQETMEELFAEEKQNYQEALKPVKEQLVESEKKNAENTEKLYRETVKANSLQGQVYSLQAENRKIQETIEYERKRNRDNGCNLF